MTITQVSSYCSPKPTKIAFALLLGCYISGHSQTPSPAKLNRVLEENVNYSYPMDPIGYVDNPCPADDFHVYAYWPDGAGANEEMVAARAADTTKIANRDLYPVPSERYLLYSKRTFQRNSAGTMKLVFHLHCVG